MRDQLADTYQLARSLAPSLVILEDLDLIAGDRYRARSKSLVDLLTSIDGFINATDGVITIATTNDPGALDEAATRAARFDRILEIPRPGLDARIAIWRRYLGQLSEGVDVETLARATDGATGADIRELVRRAILDTDGSPHQTDLVAACQRRRTNEVSPGQYL
jgi:cell division protease FtsH